MYTEKHDFHMTNPEPVSTFSLNIMKAAQDFQMDFKNRIKAAMVWISEKLPCPRPQFQIIYGADKESTDEA